MVRKYLKMGLFSPPKYNIFSGDNGLLVCFDIFGHPVLFGETFVFGSVRDGAQIIVPNRSQQIAFFNKTILQKSLFVNRIYKINRFQFVSVLFINFQSFF